MENNNEKILVVNQLKQHFKVGRGKDKITVKAVDGISFFIRRKEVFSLVGESGCGKTTTGRSIIKLYKPTDGEVFFDGKRISAGYEMYKEKIRDIKNDESLDPITKKEKIKATKEERKQAKKDSVANRKHMLKMQMIFQDPIASLNPRMTVKEIIAEGLRIQGEKDDQVITQKVYDILELVGLLPEHATRYPHEFSGGQRQRIGIARSLVVNPKLIIADEPISALDVSIQAQVINLLNELKDKLDLTILFIAHDLSVVKYFSDRVGVMYYGKLVEVADKEELFKNPVHPYTKALLSAVPLPDPNYEKKRKRTTYDPSIHNYDEEEPSMHEIKKDHFVYGSPSEIEEYKKLLK